MLTALHVHCDDWEMGARYGYCGLVAQALQLVATAKVKRPGELVLHGTDELSDDAASLRYFERVEYLRAGLPAVYEELIALESGQKMW